MTVIICDYCYRITEKIFFEMSVKKSCLQLPLICCCQNRTTNNNCQNDVTAKLLYQIAFTIWHVAFYIENNSVQVTYLYLISQFIMCSFYGMILHYSLYTKVFELIYFLVCLNCGSIKFIRMVYLYSILIFLRSTTTILLINMPINQNISST